MATDIATSESTPSESKSPKDTSASSAPYQVEIEPLTVNQYHAMINAGILQEGIPVELIDGQLLRKDRRDSEGDIMTVGPKHAYVVSALLEIIFEFLRDVPYHARCQQPITLDGSSEPEPDLTIVSGSKSNYSDHHPGPGAIQLVIEVADSSLPFDREKKLAKYAVAGIPRYWIVNLQDETVEVYESPRPDSQKYEHDHTVRNDGKASFRLDEQHIEIAVNDLFPAVIPKNSN